MFLIARRVEPEMIDDPALPEAAHAAALRGLARINRWSGSARILWPPLRAVARRATNGRARLRVLDVATGAGDVPIQLWRIARNEGIGLDIEACDRSADALKVARQNAAAAAAPIRFFAHDAVEAPLPRGYDAVVSSLFLHHLDKHLVNPFLQNLAAAANRLVLINDLERSAAGLALAYLGTRLLSRSPVVHADGPRSVRAAFTPSEARQLAHEAGLLGATTSRRWPCRYLLEWWRP